ncbi:type III secretion system stalk subunit SctO [Acidovorax cavernicola]|uniref:Type III secretion protein n=1 Tax=Acidovorax cavernicola TaxID=1675792 RepID=A0A9X8CYD7_9BURK|nr:YscO family type III secretion system apparatus protein [Acidovorax cavernicola]RIX71854.1 type III secretion protein [Acidovorax cavernicola]
MNMLRDLLAIKRFREGQAEAAMRAQRQMFQQARQERVDAEALLAQLLAAGLLAEQQLYTDLCARVVRVREIEQVHLAVAALRQREQQQQDALDAAQRQLEEAQQRFDQARSLHKEAARQTSKFIDLASRFASVEALESERREDLEMEEAASVVREREEWDGADGEAA